MKNTIDNNIYLRDSNGELMSDHNGNRTIIGKRLKTKTVWYRKVGHDYISPTEYYRRIRENGSPLDSSRKKSTKKPKRRIRREIIVLPKFTSENDW